MQAQLQLSSLVIWLYIYILRRLQEHISDGLFLFQILGFYLKMGDEQELESFS